MILPCHDYHVLFRDPGKGDWQTVRNDVRLALSFRTYGKSPYTVSCVWPATNTFPLATSGTENFTA